MDRLDGTDIVVFGVAVVGIGFGGKLGSNGDVGLWGEFLDDGVEAAGVIAVGVSDHEAVDDSVGLGDSV